VDVPFHKPELGWWVLLLGGIGLAQGAREEERHELSRRFQSLVLALGGGGMIAIGAAMVGAQWWGWAEMPPFAPAALLHHVEKVYNEGDNASVIAAISECKKAQALYPSAHPFYFLMGELYLHNNQNIDMAKALFAAERELSPRDPILVFDQGKLLTPYDVQETASLWNEALRRQLILDRLPTHPIPRSVELYQEMVSVAADYPALLARMAELSLQDLELRMIWLNHPSCDPAWIAAAVRDDILMQKLSSREKRLLFQLWFQRGEKSEVAAFLDTHPQYIHVAADTKASILAASNHEEAACRFLIEEFRIQTPELSQGEVTTIQSADSDLPSDPLAAARYYMDRGNDFASLRLLREIQEGGGENGKEAYRLQAMMAMRSGNWNEALAALQGMIRYDD